MRGLWLTIIFSFGLLACTYKVEKKTTAVNLSQGNPAPTDTINSKTVMSSVLNSCQICHSGRTQPSLNTQALLQQNADKVWKAITANNMPPPSSGYPALSDCQKTIVRQWMDAGFPENSDIQVGSLDACKNPTAGGPSTEPTPPVVEPPLAQMPLTYQTLLTKILQPKCLSCHNPDGSDIMATETLFYPLSEIQGSRRWKGPGAESGIVKILMRNDDERMPPPEAEPALSKEEVDFIIRWIDAGQPE